MMIVLGNWIPEKELDKEILAYKACWNLNLHDVTKDIL